MKMQLKSSLLCLSLLLCHFPFLMGRGRGSGGRSSGGKSSGGRSSSGSNSGVFSSNSNNVKQHNTKTNNQGSTSQRGYPKQPTQNNQGGYPVGYPRQQGGGYYYPPYGGGGNSGYPGRYINANPNNKILSPHYGASLGYGGHGSKGSSPFSQSVQSMGFYPNRDSKKFGRRAMIVAGGAAVAGVAVGYGLGRFPQPHFRFRNSQEEQHYNRYMYRKYGTRSTDTNDYSRYSRNGDSDDAPQSYDSYMDSCMNRADLLPAENGEPKDKPAAKTPNGATTPLTTSRDRNTTKTNSSLEESLLTTTPLAPSTKRFSSAEEDDTVSIEEIGYPALIEQLKVRKCLELYLNRLSGGGQGLTLGLAGLLSVVFSSTLLAITAT